MEKNTTTFETGATSSAVNELILYTDNTRELATVRDVVYSDLLRNEIKPEYWYFKKLLTLSTNSFIQEFPANHWHVSIISEQQKKEYCQIYANRFAEWKKEKERNSK